MSRPVGWFQAMAPEKQDAYREKLRARKASPTSKSTSADFLKDSPSPSATSEASPVPGIPPPKAQKKSHHKTKVENPGPLESLKATLTADGKFRELPEDPKALEAALAPYRYSARTMMLGESKLREFVLDGEPADKDELAAGIDAFAGLLYAYGFNALHPGYAFLIFQVSFLGPDMIKQREKILAVFKKDKVKSKPDKVSVEFRQAGPGVAPEVKVTEQSGNPPRTVEGERIL